MTLDDLCRIYVKAYDAELERTEDLGDLERAGIRAVVAAIREATQLRPGGCEQCKHNLIVLHEILASDGVEAAGSATRLDSSAPAPAAAYCHACLNAIKSEAAR